MHPAISDDERQDATPLEASKPRLNEADEDVAAWRHCRAHAHIGVACARQHVVATDVRWIPDDKIGVLSMDSEEVVPLSYPGIDDRSCVCWIPAVGQQLTDGGLPAAFNVLLLEVEAPEG